MDNAHTEGNLGEENRKKREGKQNKKVKIQVANMSFSYFTKVISSPVLLLISPSAHGIQSKQQTGSPFLLAFRVPGGQLSLHTEIGT